MRSRWSATELSRARSFGDSETRGELRGARKVTSESNATQTHVTFRIRILVTDLGTLPLKKLKEYSTKRKRDSF